MRLIAASQWYFNPRSHKGSDTAYLEKEVREEISIHAPTRGATFVTLPDLIELVFQSTLPQGERLSATR